MAAVEGRHFPRRARRLPAAALPRLFAQRELRDARAQRLARALELVGGAAELLRGLDRSIRGRRERAHRIRDRLRALRLALHAVGDGAVALGVRVHFL
ncbi:MAG: hypothetical protein ACK56I_30005, partial [bacterium]